MYNTPVCAHCFAEDLLYNNSLSVKAIYHVACAKCRRITAIDVTSHIFYAIGSWNTYPPIYPFLKVAFTMLENNLKCPGCGCEGSNVGKLTTYACGTEEHQARGRRRSFACESRELANNVAAIVSDALAIVSDERPMPSVEWLNAMNRAIECTNKQFTSDDAARAIAAIIQKYYRR